MKDDVSTAGLDYPSTPPAWVSPRQVRASRWNLFFPFGTAPTRFSGTTGPSGSMELETKTLLFHTLALKLVNVINKCP